MGNSSMGDMVKLAAQHTSASTRPCSRSTVSTAACTLSAALTSSASARQPVGGSAPLAKERAAAYTIWPSAARHCAAALPKPEEAPTTNTIFCGI